MNEREGAVLYNDTTKRFKEVYESIEDDIKAMRKGDLKLADARVILVARKTQLRTAELVLATHRLVMQYERFDKEAQKRLRKAV